MRGDVSEVTSRAPHLASWPSIRLCTKGFEAADRASQALLHIKGPRDA